MMDMAWWALDLRFLISCEAKGPSRTPTPAPPGSPPHGNTPANDWRGPVEVNWYDGGKKPGVPGSLNRDAAFKGVIFQGERAGSSPTTTTASSCSAAT